MSQARGTPIPKDLPTQTVAEQLGMVRSARRYGPCPACGAAKDPSYARRGPVWVSGPRWACSGCQEKGDAITLISWAVNGHGKPRGQDFKKVMDWLADRHHVDLAVVDEAPAPRAPSREVAAILRACTRPARHPFFARKGLDYTKIPAGILPDPGHGVYRRLTRVPYEGRDVPWWPARWSATWRLVVPAFNGHGHLAGLHARALEPGVKPKTRWPLGVDCRGLIFADPLIARPFLRGGPAPSRLLIVEGLSDFLYAASQGMPDLGIIGMESGSEQALRLIKIPPTCTVYVSAHNDTAGDRYAALVADAFAPRAVKRLPLPRTQQAA